MSKKDRSPEETARLAKIRELLQASNISNMDDIQDLFKETIAEFMENGLDAETRNSATASITTETKIRTTAGMDTAARPCAPASEMWMSPCPGTGTGSSSRSC